MGRNLFLKRILLVAGLYALVLPLSGYAQVSTNAEPNQPLQLTPVNPRPNYDQIANQFAKKVDPYNLFPEPNALQKKAYEQMTSQAMPMTPKEILKLKDMLAVTQRAAAASAETPPKPTLSTQDVSLQPGATPPVIRLQQGFVTSVVFVDSTGADWPIDSYDLGNPRAFNIQWTEHSNTMMIQAISMYTYGNLAVKLVGLSTPVMLTLVPGQQVVDYRTDLRVQGYGPNAKTLVMGDNLPAAASSVLLNVLNGIPPQDAQVLQVSDESCTAWALGDKMYLRTKLTLLSPGWIGVMSSADGTKAYEMMKTSSILVSKYGKPVALQIGV